LDGAGREKKGLFETPIRPPDLRCGQRVYPIVAPDHQASGPGVTIWRGGSLATTAKAP